MSEDVSRPAGSSADEPRLWSRAGLARLAGRQDFWDALFVGGLAFAVTFAGGVGTGVYFGGAILALAAFANGSRRFSIPPLAISTMLSFGLLYLTILASPLFFENAATGWSIAGSNLQLIVAPLILASLVAGRADDLLRLFARGCSLGVPASFLIGLEERLRWGLWPDGNAGNQLIYAATATIGGFVAVTCFRRETGLWRLLGLAAIVSAAGINLMVLSKNAMIVFAILGIIWTVHAIRSGSIGFRNAWKGAIIAAALLAPAVYASSLGSDQIRNRIVMPVEKLIEKGLTLEGVFDGQRAIMYRLGWDIALENPLIGVGLQNTVGSVAERLPADGSVTLKKFTHLHSVFLQHFAGSGIFGLLALLMVFITPLAKVMQQKPCAEHLEQRYFALVTVVGFSVSGLTNTFTTNDVLMTFYCGAIIVLLVTLYRSASSQSR